MSGCVYIFENQRNGLFYVGQTTNPTQRAYRHRTDLKAGRHKSPRLQHDWDLQNGEDFVFKVLYEVVDETHLLTLEQFVLTAYPDKCYNASRYSNAPHKGKTGKEHPASGSKSEEHIQKIRKGLLVYYKNKEHPLKGIPRSAATKAKISQAQVGKQVSDATRERQRLAHLGRVWTEEEKQKLRKPKGRSLEHAAKFQKAIIEKTSGEIFPSLKAVKERFEVSPGQLSKYLAKEGPITKGKLKGKWFAYVLSGNCAGSLR